LVPIGADAKHFERNWPKISDRADCSAVGTAATLQHINSEHYADIAYESCARHRDEDSSNASQFEWQFWNFRKLDRGT